MRHLLLYCVTLSALAQPPAARLEGIVEDPSGAPVIDARVTAKEQHTGLSTGVRSNREGLYVFLSLPPGEYTVTVEANGFRTTELRALVLNVSSTVTAPVHLELGAMTETIDVRARETSVQLADTQGGGVVAQHDIELLPQEERNPVKLAVFEPGVQVSAGSIGLSTVNGSRVGSNEIKLDGLDILEPMSPALGFALPISSDLIQEFRIITYSAKAEYGRNSGAQIEIVTRSGTNELHAGLFEYFRNAALGANNLFNNSALAPVPRPKLVYNTVGGSAGGAVRRDRTFYFLSYQRDLDEQ